jgi:hypothetical protein
MPDGSGVLDMISWVGKCWGEESPLLHIVYPVWHNRSLKFLMRQGDTSMPKYEFSKERESALALAGFRRVKLFLEFTVARTPPQIPS